MSTLGFPRPVAAILSLMGLSASFGCDRVKGVFEKPDSGSVSSSASSSSEHAPPIPSADAATTPSTGIAECDSYLALYQKCIPSIPASTIKKMSESYQLARSDPQARGLTAKSCAEAEKRLRRDCP